MEEKTASVRRLGSTENINKSSEEIISMIIKQTETPN